MVKNILQYKILFVVFIVVLAIVLGVGFWFADKKSEPQYASKIDQLMFDRDNKAPKFILTLSEQKEKKLPPKPKVTTDIVVPQVATDQEVKELTIEEIIERLPLLSKLQANEPTQTLDFITIDQELTETNGDLILPKISKDGKKPWAEYGKNVEILPNFKKVAIIFKNMGLNPEATNYINKGFASEVSFSFTPYAVDGGTKILSARQFGHETYVDMLLSSKDFLKSDSGPMSMSITISKDEALERLQKTLSTGAPIGGVVINDGIADEDNVGLLSFLLSEIKNRGLLMIDATKEDGIANIDVSGLARRKADVIIDEDFSKKAINEAIKKAENIAFLKGQVLLVVDPKPVVVLAVKEWVDSFSPQVSYEDAHGMEIDKPLALVPVSNLVVE